MAERELSILVRAKGALQAAKDIGKVDSAVGNLGRTAATGVRNAATNITRIGIVAAAGVGVAVKGGLESLAELESAVTAVDGAIDQMGLTGQVTGTQIAGWANDIERDIGAAFDDKEITAAAATMLRFGKVTPANLRPSLVVLTDLAVKTGSVDSAAQLLAKALVDPEKAAGKLARSGVVLTKVEQKQIKELVKAGKAGEAQALILDRVAASTEGAAEASQGPYKRSLSVLADVTEDAQKALATGFLPVIEKVADLLGKELAKPATLDNIRKFGEGLAGGLDKLIDIARGLPWGTIGDSLKIAGSGAKAVLDVLTSMPPWVQTAVLTGWGLNKLTGGALGSIVGQLGSGLIKGVLGMNAGVVNINAGVVNGGGPLPGAAAMGGAAAGAGIGGGAAAALGLAGPAIGVALGELSRQAFEQMPSHQQQMALRAGRTRQDAVLGRPAPERTALSFTADPAWRSANAAARLGNRDRAQRAGLEADVIERATAKGNKPTTEAVQRTADKTAARQEAATRAAATQTLSGWATGVNQIVTAIRSINIPQPRVNVNVTSTDVQRATARRKRIAKPSGSRGALFEQYG